MPFFGGFASLLSGLIAGSLRKSCLYEGQVQYRHFSGFTT